jgi:hypothetical protein
MFDSRPNQRSGQSQDVKPSPQDVQVSTQDVKYFYEQ